MLHTYETVPDILVRINLFIMSTPTTTNLMYLLYTLQWNMCVCRAAPFTGGGECFPASAMHCGRFNIAVVENIKAESSVK